MPPARFFKIEVSPGGKICVCTFGDTATLHPSLSHLMCLFLFNRPSTSEPFRNSGFITPTNAIEAGRNSFIDVIFVINCINLWRQSTANTTRRHQLVSNDGSAVVSAWLLKWRLQPTPYAAYYQTLVGSESSIVRGIGSIQGPLRCLGVGGRFAKESSQLTAAKEVAEDYLHPNSQVISDRIPRVGVRAGSVSSVRATGLSAPTSILSTAGPVLGRRYALRWPVGPWRLGGGKTRSRDLIRRAEVCVRQNGQHFQHFW